MRDELRNVFQKCNASISKRWAVSRLEGRSAKLILQTAWRGGGTPTPFAQLISKQQKNGHRLRSFLMLYDDGEVSIETHQFAPSLSERRSSNFLERTHILQALKRKKKDEKCNRASYETRKKRGRMRYLSSPKSRNTSCIVGNRSCSNSTYRTIDEGCESLEDLPHPTHTRLDYDPSDEIGLIGHWSAQDVEKMDPKRHCAALQQRIAAIYRKEFSLISGTSS